MNSSFYSFAIRVCSSLALFSSERVDNEVASHEKWLKTRRNPSVRVNSLQIPQPAFGNLCG